MGLVALRLTPAGICDGDLSAWTPHQRGAQVPVSGHEFRVAEEVSDENRIVGSCDEAPWRMTQTVSRTDRSPAATLVSLPKLPTTGDSALGCSTRARRAIALRGDPDAPFQTESSNTEPGLGARTTPAWSTWTSRGSAATSRRGRVVRTLRAAGGGLGTRAYWRLFVWPATRLRRCSAWATACSSRPATCSS
jgi:hypothetical protein